jgi:hypothetical protein
MLFEVNGYKTISLFCIFGKFYSSNSCHKGYFYCVNLQKIVIFSALA